MLEFLKPFEYLQPATVAEACSLLRQHRGRSKLLAGGTDLLIRLKERKVDPQYVIDLGGIRTLDTIAYSDTAGLTVGALATHQILADSPTIQQKFDFLGVACAKVGTPQIRNMGTIGGNICMAGPSQDTLPVLLALDARLKLVNREGERIVPADRFFLSPFQTVCNEDEVLVEVQVPAAARNSAGCYQWLTKITEADETLVGVAVFLAIDAGSGKCEEIRIGLGSVAPTAIRARRTEALIKGNVVTDRLIAAAAKVAAEETSPRSRAAYRRQMTAVLTGRTIKGALEKLRRQE